mmetsp:Transcript_39000/g.76672  ORF Transcript_39000/g.76672 Transcript_39000/m.76672 type:complete len:84 (+) Transcript_39000:180-431(+)
MANFQQVLAVAVLSLLAYRLVRDLASTPQEGKPMAGDGEGGGGVGSMLKSLTESDYVQHFFEARNPLPPNVGPKTVTVQFCTS